MEYGSIPELTEIINVSYLKGKPSKIASIWSFAKRLLPTKGKKSTNL